MMCLSTLPSLLWRHIHVAELCRIILANRYNQLLHLATFSPKKLQAQIGKAQAFACAKIRKPTALHGRIPRASQKLLQHQLLHHNTRPPFIYNIIPSPKILVNGMRIALVSGFMPLMPKSVDLFHKKIYNGSDNQEKCKSQFPL